jgi:pullulanase
MKAIKMSLFLLAAVIGVTAGCGGGGGGGGTVAGNTMLSNISLSGGIRFTEPFAGERTEYTAYVAADAAEISVTVYAGDARQEIEVDGEAIDAEVPFAVALENSTTTTRIDVTAPDDSERRYTLTFIKGSIDDNESRLSSVAVRAASGSVRLLSPMYDPDTLSYMVNIVAADSPVTIVPTAMSPYAAITVEGQAVATGTASKPITVEKGAKKSIAITSTSKGGIRTTEYEITVNCAGDFSNNAFLSSLVVSGSAVGTWSRNFSPNLNDYTVTFPQSVESVSITPTVEDAGKATVAVKGERVNSGSAYGPLALVSGETTVIPVVVTAEDGTVNEYTLRIAREGAESDNANLSQLSLGNVSLSPSFVKTAFSYEASVSSAISSVSLSAVAEDAAATVTVNGAAYTCGTVVDINLGNPGSVTSIPVVVTAASGRKQTYVVAVTRTAEIIIHFEKPASWSEAWIWFDKNSDNTWDTTVLKTSPGDMTKYRDEGGFAWYKKDMGLVPSVTFLFNDGTWANKLQTGGKDFKATTTVWVRADGSMTDYDPIGPVKPKITVNPAGGSFNEAPYPVTISIVSDSDVTERSYAIVKNNEAPVTVSMASNSVTIDIAAAMVVGDVKKLTVTALNSAGRTTTTAYEFSMVNEVSAKLGVSYSASGSTFSIWSPDSSNVKLELSGVEHTCAKVPDFDGYTDVYSVTVPGDHKLKEYSFKINGVKVRDPYGVMVKPGTTTNIVMNLAETNPVGGWTARPVLANREDSIIYEVHIKDFTYDADSGVDADKRGKYLGMTQTGTKYSGLATGIDHLKELGVTHVQILPFYDFATNGPNDYNWGYDPVNFNVPEEVYASSADYQARIREVKTMINELHRNGIRVIMDVVYNHTANNDVFDPISTKYYIFQNGVRADASGCGNGLDTGNAMVRRFIRDSLEYWVKEYNIDGFRFDLMGIFKASAVKEWGEYLNGKYPDRNILMYGEPWNGFWNSDQEFNSRAVPSNRPIFSTGHVGIFNGGFREGLKGGCDDARGGFMFNWSGLWGSKGHLSDVITGIGGSLKATNDTNPASTDNMWNYASACDPEQSVNYISAHDNFCLWDKIRVTLATSITSAKYWGGEKNPPDSIDTLYSLVYDTAKDAYAMRINKFGTAMVLTSQGLPFIHAGDEFRRTKEISGDWSATRNSYNSATNFNMIRWQLKSSQPTLYSYYKNMVALRKAHPAFRMTTWEQIKNNVTVTQVPGKSVVIYTINGAAVGDSWKKIIAVFNSDASYSYTLPSGSWKVAVEKENAAVGGTAVTGSYACEGTAATIFYQE